MKKTVLILTFLLVLTSFCYVHVNKVEAFDICPDWKVIGNGSYPFRTERFSHGGRFSMGFAGSQSSKVEQTHSPSIPVNNMDSWTFYVYHNEVSQNYDVEVTVNYTDGSSTIQGFSGSSASWVQKDILTGLSANKNVNRTQFRGVTSCGFVDDVSLLVSSVEQISNGDFEDPDDIEGERIHSQGYELGNKTGWFFYGGSVGSATVHSGVYSANIDYGSRIEQEICPFVLTDNVTTFDVWIYHESERASQTVSIKVDYSDASSDTFFPTSTFGSWVEVDCIAELTLGKNISHIKISNSDSMEFHTTHIDDWSLLANEQEQPSDAPVVGPNPQPSHHRLWVTVLLNGEWVKGCNVTVKGGPDDSSVWTLTNLFGKAKFKVKSGSYEIEASYQQYRKTEPVDISKATDITINLSEFDYVRVAVPRVPDGMGWFTLPDLDLTTETLLFLLLPLIVLVIYAIKKATEGPQKRWKYSYLK